MDLSQRRTALGYVQFQALRDTLLSRAGEQLRGHEFHWSRLAEGQEHANAYQIVEPTPRIEGFSSENVLASYIHLHFGASPHLAASLVQVLR